jgi:hypothetical protein
MMEKGLPLSERANVKETPVNQLVHFPPGLINFLCRPLLSSWQLPVKLSENNTVSILEI